MGFSLICANLHGHVVTSENATKETAGEASQSDAAVEKPENKTETSAESKDSKDPKDPPQGPVGLFSHGTIS